MSNRKSEAPLTELQLISLLAIVSFCFSLSFLDPINWPKQIALFVVSVYLLSISIFTIHRRSKKTWSIEALLLFGLLLSWIIPQLFTNVPIARFLWGAFGRNNGFITQTSLVLIAYSCYLLALRSLRVDLMLKWIIVYVFVSALYGVVQFLGEDPVPWSKQDEVFSFFGNTNFASAIFSLGVSSFLVLLFGMEKKLSTTQFASYFFMTSVIFFALIHTNSIQGFGGVIITCFLLALRKISLWRKKLGLLLLAVSAPFTVIIFFGLLGEGPLGSFLYQYTLRLRMYYWVAGIRMGTENLLKGVGVDSYGDFYREFRPIEVIALTGPDLTTNNAHNPLVQIFATVGLPAFIFVTLLVVFAAMCAIFLIISSNVKNSSSVALGTLYISVWSMAFFSIDNIAIAVWNWFILGALIGQAQLSMTEEGKMQRRIYLNSFSQYARTLSLIIASIAFAASWYSSSPNRSLASTFSKSISTSDSLLVNKRSAIAVDVANSLNTRESEYIYAADAFMSLGLVDKAIQTLVIGSKAFPRDFEILDKLANLAERKGMASEVLDIRLRQVELEPNNWKLWYVLAREYLRNGMKEEANTVYPNIERSAKLLSNYPADEIRQMRIELGFKN